MDAHEPSMSTDACALAESEPDNRVAHAACDAIGPFARGEFIGAFDLLLADVTARRFEVAELSNVWPQYVELLTTSPSTLLRVYARVADANAHVTIEELATLGPIDSVTGRALHCADHPPPSDLAARMADDADAGGYGATHALLALIWLEDVHCPLTIDAALREHITAAAAAVIDTNHAVTSDVEIEAAALLAHTGETSRIPEGFLEGLVANQQVGGGWAEEDPDGPPTGHASGLAMWYLHEVLFPFQTIPMVNPNARTL